MRNGMNKTIDTRINNAKSNKQNNEDYEHNKNVPCEQGKFHSQVQ